jgi:hypothetical protein
MYETVVALAGAGFGVGVGVGAGVGAGVGVGVVDVDVVVVVVGADALDPQPLRANVVAASRHVALNAGTINRMRVSIGGGTDSDEIREASTLDG